MIATDRLNSRLRWPWASKQTGKILMSWSRCIGTSPAGTFIRTRMLPATVINALFPNDMLPAGSGFGSWTTISPLLYCPTSSIAIQVSATAPPSGAGAGAAGIACAGGTAAGPALAGGNPAKALMASPCTLPWSLKFAKAAGVMGWKA